MPILLIFLSNTTLFAINWLITSYSCFTVTTCKSILAILVFSADLEAVAVIGIAFNNILLT